MGEGALWLGTGGGAEPGSGGTAKTLVPDVWYTQALRITYNSNGARTGKFFINLPSVAPGDYITATTNTTWGVGNPPSPKITFGDSPWYAGYQHERLSGVLRGIKIIAKSLSDADLLAEAASDAFVTADGIANVWYMNINPTPDDITDKSGAGHHPTWASSTRASLYTDSTDPVVPNPPSNVRVE